MSENYGWVYLIRANGTQLYKIGYTSQKPEKRLSSLQTASPHELSLQYAVNVENYERMEEALHRHYSESREKNEWFRFSEEDARDVQNEMRDWLRHRALDQATEPLKSLSGEFLSDPEEFLTTVLADVAKSVFYQQQEKDDATEILKRLNRENLLGEYYRDHMEQHLNEDTAREILRVQRTSANSGWICFIKAQGTNFYRFRATKDKPEVLLDRPVPKVLTDSSEGFAILDSFEVENIDQIERELEETFSFLQEQGPWLLLDDEEDVEMVRDEMKLTVREHQFRDLPLDEISGDYVTDAEEVMCDALSEMVFYMARSNINAVQVLQCLYISNLLPPRYEQVIRQRLDDDEVRNILGK